MVYCPSLEAKGQSSELLLQMAEDQVLKYQNYYLGGDPSPVSTSGHFIQSFESIICISFISEDFLIMLFKNT